MKNTRAASAAFFASTRKSRNATLELLGWVFIGLAWLVPNHYPPWNSFYNDTAAAIGLIFLAASAFGALQCTALHRTTWCIAASALIPCAQWAGGLLHFSGDALVAALYIMGFSLATGVGYVKASSHAEQFSAGLAIAILAGALCSAFIALTQALQVGDLGFWFVEAPPGLRAYANLAQPNNLATLIGFGAVSLWLLHERGRIAKWAATAALSVLVLAVAMTQSRTALLFGPALACILTLVSRRGLRFGAGPKAILMVTACQAVLTLGWPYLQDLLGLSAPLSLAARGVESVRFQVWPMLIEALGARPWLGFGWLQVGAAEMSVAGHHAPVGELWLHGHNVVIELLVWCGWPLGLLLAGSIAWWYVDRLRCIATLESAAGVLTLTVFAVHAMLELPHHYAYFLLPAGLWIGVIEAQRPPGRHVHPAWNAVPMLVGLLLLVAVVRDYPAIEEDFRLVRFENLAIGTLRAKQPAPDAPFLSSLTGFLRFARATPASGMKDEEIEQMRWIVERYPYSISMARLATALALNGRMEEALLTFARLRGIHGDVMYRKLRRAVHEQVLEGKSQLAELDRSLPP
jgi:hypothetical protein